MSSDHASARWLRVAVKRVGHRIGFDVRRYNVCNVADARRSRLLESGAYTVVLDVGANAGSYGRALRDGGFSGTIISFEPLSEPFKRLQAAAEGDPGWWCERIALGEVAAESTMNVASNDGASSSFLEMTPGLLQAVPELEYVGREPVTVNTLDAYARDRMHPGDRIWLKMDVQGYELSILRGSQELLPQIAAVEVEVSFAELYVGQPLFEDVMSALSRLGLRVVSLEPGFCDRATGHLLQADIVATREIDLSASDLKLSTSGSTSRPSGQRLRLARTILRCCPVTRGRWRLAGVLLAGRTLPSEELLRRVTPRLPAKIVRCRNGLRVPIRKDAMYLSPYLFGDYEPTQSRVFRKLIREGDTVLDVGANFGWYSSLFARWTGPSGRVYAFEPIAHLEVLAREMVALNDLGGVVRLEPSALGDTAGSLDVYTFEGLPHGHASASTLGRPDAVAHHCEVTTLDSFVSAHAISQIDFMKVDVEGFEREVFRGGRTTLQAANAPVVHFEVNQKCLRYRGIDPAAIVEEVLRPFGYSGLWNIQSDRGVRRVHEVDTSQDADYVMCKEKDMQRISSALEPKSRAYCRNGYARRLASRR